MSSEASDSPISIFGDDPLWIAVEQQCSVDAAGLPRTQRARPAPPNPNRSPRPAFKSRPRRTAAVPPSAAQDPEIHQIKRAIETVDPVGLRCGLAIRRALDQSYDGRRTGRWDVTQLTKAEAANIGSMMEIWLQRALGLSDGITTSLQIAGCDVACAWSEQTDGWTVDRPGLEQRELPYLLIWASEETSRFGLGILRPSHSSRGVASMDRGRPRLSQVGIDQILWVHDGCALPANALTKHPDVAMEAVRQTSGQRAVNMLFRRLQGELVHHTAVETVAQQIDSSKRIRDARRHLKDEGIIILGNYQPHPEIAAALGLPSPRAGTFVSHRLALLPEGDPGMGATISGHRWRLADLNDPVVVAPEIPTQGR